MRIGLGALQWLSSEGPSRSIRPSPEPERSVGEDEGSAPRSLAQAKQPEHGNEMPADTEDEKAEALAAQWNEFASQRRPVKIASLASLKPSQGRS